MLMVLRDGQVVYGTDDGAMDERGEEGRYSASLKIHAVPRLAQL